MVRTRSHLFCAHTDRINAWPPPLRLFTICTCWIFENVERESCLTRMTMASVASNWLVRKSWSWFWSFEFHACVNWHCHTHSQGGWTGRAGLQGEEQGLPVLIPFPVALAPSVLTIGPAHCCCCFCLWCWLLLVEVVVVSGSQMVRDWWLTCASRWVHHPPSLLSITLWVEWEWWGRVRRQENTGEKKGTLKSHKCTLFIMQIIKVCLYCHIVQARKRKCACKQR